MLPTWLKAYAKRHEIDEEVQRRILSVSPATLERVLSDCKVDDAHNAIKQTISALKQSIPIIDAMRKVDIPGHLYADTVAHCGDSTRGSFVRTLTVTDDLTLCKEKDHSKPKLSCLQKLDLPRFSSFY